MQQLKHIIFQDLLNEPRKTKQNIWLPISPTIQGYPGDIAACFSSIS